MSWLVSLRQAGENATSGPWFQSCPPWQPDGRFVYAGSEDPHAALLVADCDPDPELPDADVGERFDNAEFIVLARNTWPLVVDALEAAEAEHAAFHPDGWPTCPVCAALASLRAAAGEK